MLVSFLIRNNKIMYGNFGQLNNLKTEKLKAENRIEAGLADLKFLLSMPQKERLLLKDTLSEEEWVFFFRIKRKGRKNNVFFRLNAVPSVQSVFV